MKVYRLESLTGVEGLKQHDEPTPDVGPGQVRVRVRASAINYRDLALASGKYPFPVKARTVPHSDAAGEVVEVGAGVTRFQVGARVMSTFFVDWVGGARRQVPQQYMVDHDGWLAETKVVDANALVAIPDHLSFEEAATLGCAGVTAWNAVAGLRPGDTVVTQGTGGVAVFAVQFAKAMGARVIATTSTSEKAIRLRGLGADEVIDYTVVPEWSRAVRELTEGFGADRVVDLGGPGTLTQSIAAVAQRGQVSLVGALGTGEPVDFFKLFLSQARYETIAVGSRSDTEDMNRAIAAHRIRPVIDRVFDFDEAPAAWRHFGGRDRFGKVVVRH